MSRVLGDLVQKNSKAGRRWQGQAGRREAGVARCVLRRVTLGQRGLLMVNCNETVSFPIKLASWKASVHPAVTLRVVRRSHGNSCVTTDKPGCPVAFRGFL